MDNTMDNTMDNDLKMNDAEGVENETLKDEKELLEASVDSEKEDNKKESTEECSGNKKEGNKRYKINFKELFYILILVTAVVFMTHYIDKLYLGYGFSGIDSSYDTGSSNSINSVIQEVEKLYKSDYIGDIDYSKLEDGALSGYVASIGDKYGYYLSNDDSGKYRNNINERLVGIGVEVVYEEDEDSKQLYVAGIKDDSPAEKAGIAVGDIITHVNGKSLYDLSYGEFIKSVLGEEGTDVTIKVNDKDVTLTRQALVNKSVSSKVIKDTVSNEDVGYIKIKSFTYGTEKEFIEEFEELVNDKKVSKVVFDVRNNSGGLLDGIVPTLDYLLPEGLIVRIENKNGTKGEFNSDNNEAGNGIKMAIVVNRETASAAELFTLALRDYGKAVVVGEQTYGKGTAATMYSLSNGGSVNISTGLYYTKDSENIEGIGITPDIKCNLSEDKENIYYKLDAKDDDQIQYALAYLRSNK